MKRILICDDEPHIVEGLRHLLRAPERTIAVASNGIDALERVAEQRPDLLIIDVMMPEMSGLEVVANLRSSDACRELLLNAVEWGGQLDPKRKVRIACVRTNRMLIYRIADPGPGFQLKGLDHAAIAHPDNPLEHLRIREEKGLRAGGFGILMVRAKVDELVYNEKQNEVVFVKYLD